jgi:hypothetical protein
MDRAHSFSRLLQKTPNADSVFAFHLRTPKRAGRPPRNSPIPEADAAMALNDAITGVVVALGKVDVAQARAMRRRAWELSRCCIPLKQCVSVAYLGCLAAG